MRNSGKLTAAWASGPGLARAGLIVTSAYLASRIVGWVRVGVIGATFGASRDLDAFYAAFRIPDLIFQLVAAGALASALVPVLASLLGSGDSVRAWRVASTVTNVMLLGLAVAAALGYVAAPTLVPAIAPGFDAPTMDRTIGLTRIMLLSPIFLALGSVATSILNVEGRFGAAAAAPIVYNLAIIAGAVVLGPSLGVDGLAVGVVTGSALHLLIQLPSLRVTGARYQPVIDRADPAARQALMLMAPRALGLGVSQLSLVVYTSLASSLAVGSVTAFNVAFLVFQIPIGVIGVPLGIVLFPSFSRYLAGGAVGEFLVLLDGSLRLIVFVMLPITTLGIVLGRAVVGLLFDYGRFGQPAVDAAAGALVFLLAGLTAESLIVVLARGFYAARDTRTPVGAAIVAVVINVVVGVGLVGPMGLAGLAVALAAGAWIEALTLVVMLRGRYPDLDLRGVARVFAQSVTAAGGAGVLALLLLTVLEAKLGVSLGKLGLLVEIALVGGVGGLTYIAFAAAFRMRELSAIGRIAVRLFDRRPRQ